METSLVMFVPGLHAGYISLFEKYMKTQPILYLVGRDILSWHPMLVRDRRTVDPEVMAHILQGTGYFKQVRVADSAMLCDLGLQPTGTIVLSQDSLSRDLHARYFRSSPITWENVFLRYDEDYVRNTTGEAQYDCAVTEEAFLRDVLGLAESEAQKSSDWFRRVGAALLLPRDGQTIRLAHNQRMPTEHEPWLVGDPRNFLVYGSDPNLSTVVHAEKSLINVAARDGIATKGASIVVTTYPCPSCCNDIAQAGIVRCYFKSGYAALPDHDVFRIWGVEVVKIV